MVDPDPTPGRLPDFNDPVEFREWLATRTIAQGEAIAGIKALCTARGESCGRQFEALFQRANATNGVVNKAAGAAEERGRLATVAVSLIGKWGPKIILSIAAALALLGGYKVLEAKPPNASEVAKKAAQEVLQEIREAVAKEKQP